MLVELCWINHVLLCCHGTAAATKAAPAGAKAAPAGAKAAPEGAKAAPAAATAPAATTAAAKPKQEALPEVEINLKELPVALNDTRGKAKECGRYVR